jgi:Tol biopolymer transport system component
VRILSRCLSVLLALGSTFAPGWLPAAQQTAVVDPAWDTTRPRGQTRTIDFRVDEGTGMSVDVSPDGRTIVFDLLGHLYTVPTTGGLALCITQDSGIASNFHPKFSPDGRSIAFVSDRSGQNSLWVSNADGTEPRQIFLDPDTRISEPAWSPDGQRIAAVRAFPTPGRGYHRLNTQIWEFSVSTGAARALLSDRNVQYNAPAYAADGASLYLHASYFSGNRFGTQVGHHLERLSLGTGMLVRLESGAKPEHGSAASIDSTLPQSAEMPAEISPVPSPDGRFLAFAREQLGQSFAFRGHRLGPSTALFLRDLSTGAERLLMDPITKDLSSAHAMYSYRVLPGYAWSGDSKSIILSEGGKIRHLDVATRAVTTIPFDAHVMRTVSEQVRGHVDIDDRAFKVKFLQWPSSSPDGKRLAFVAAGHVWIMDLPRGTPRRLVDTPGPGFQLTPSWSADGRTVIFATWDDVERGQIWRAGVDGHSLRRLSSSAGEYLYPQFTHDARDVVFVQGGSGPQAHWNGWANVGPWNISRLSLDSGVVTSIANLKVLREPVLSADGRVYFESQPDPAAAAGLYEPYPPPQALEQIVHLQSVGLDGGEPRVHLAFPPFWPRFTGSHRPVISPDGKWVAYPNPNVPHADTTRVGAEGGMYHRWRNSGVLEFVSGSDYVTYDVRTGARRTTPVDLRIPRDVPTGRIAFTNGRIVTMDGARVLENASIVVEGMRIACVGACDVADAQRVIDVRGKTIIPGLFDVHAHNTIEPSGVMPAHRPGSAAYLAYGVTTTLDPQTVSASGFPMAEMTEAGLIRGPRLFSTAELVVSKGAAFGNMLEIRSFDDAVHEVSRRAKWGAIAIKNFRQSRRDQTQKLVEAARRNRVTVTGEGGPLFFDIALAMDGQTGWEHYIADLPIYRDVSQFLGQAGVTYSPTAIVSGHGLGSADYFRSRTDLLADEKYRRFVPSTDIPVFDLSTGPMPAELFSFPMVAEGLRDVIRAGGHGAIGEHAEQRGIGCIWEILGYGFALTPMEALRVASLDAARFHGLDHLIGSIRTGKVADLVILDANPLDDLQNLLSIRLVMKGGNLYDASTLDQIWPREDRFGPTAWEHRTKQ